MKRLLLIAPVIAALIVPSIGWSAGSCTQSLASTANTNVKVVTFTCTGDSSDGTIPSTDTSAAITTAISGFYLTEVRTNPGTTAPTALYDVVINDTDGIDLMGGTLVDRSATVSQAAIPAPISGIYGARPIDGALTLVITNNSVNSAGIVLKLFLTK